MSCLNNYNLDVILNQLNCWCLQWRGKIATVFPSGMTQIEQIQELFTAVKNCCEAQVEVMEKFCELYKFVHDFFDNLDLQEEVNNWLEQALEDGRLGNILQKIVYSPINVKQAGAVPDTGEDLTEKLNTILIAHPDGEFYFPDGTYILNGTINIDSNVTFILEENAIISTPGNDLFTFTLLNKSFKMMGGQIQAGTLDNFNKKALTGNVFNSGLFSFTNCKDVSISHVTNNFNTTGNTFKFTDCENVKIKQFEGYKCLYACIIFYDGCKNVSVENSIFKEIKRSTEQQYCYPVASGFSTYSQEISAIENYVIDNCEFDDCDWEGCDCHGGKNIRFSNLKMHNCNRFVTIYSDNRPQLKDYNFENAIIENCYFVNDTDYEPPTPDASIYCNGRYNRYFTNMLFKNIYLENPVCYDSNENTTYGAIFTNYNRNVRLENVKIVANKTYSVNPFVIYGLCMRNLVIKGMEIIGMPGLTNDGPIHLQYATGEMDDITVLNNSITYAAVFTTRPCRLIFGRNIGGWLTRQFYVARNTHLMNEGEVIPFGFPMLSPSNSYGSFATTTHKGYGLSLGSSDAEVSKNVTIVSGNKELNLDKEYYFAPVGTSVSVKQGDNTLDTIITDFRENYVTIADTPNFGGSGTITINRLLRTEITTPPNQG